MDEMATNTEYILRMVLELIDKCKTLEELREAVKAVLDETKYKGQRGHLTSNPPPIPQGATGSLTPAASMITK